MRSDRMKIGIGKLTGGVGDALIDMGKWMLKKSVELKYYTISLDELQKLSKSQMDTDSWCLDRRYQYTDLEAWKKIIQYWHGVKRKYKADVYDCENFSMSFSSFCSEIFDLNSAGRTLGAVLQSNQIVGYHAWNTLIVKSGDKTELWSYEPQGLTLKRTSKITDMNWAQYRSDMTIWG